VDGMKWKGKSLYNNKKTVLDGMLFDSLGEAKHYQSLLLLQTSGEISCLERQTPFALIVNSVKLGTMKWDYTYIEHGQKVAFDWKGYRNQERIWNFKRKLVQALYPDWRFITNVDKVKKVKKK
jgi:hypothetical protein